LIATQSPTAAEKGPTMPVVNDPQVPLLSFLITVYTDLDTQKRFAEKPEAVMDEYKLTWDQKVAVYHAGADPMFLTSKPVEGFPVMLDPEKISTDPAAGRPNPVSADWWAAYARFKAKVEASGSAELIRNPGVNERKVGHRASMAGLMALLGEELAQTPKWIDVW
jgi:hypothetical protein